MPKKRVQEETRRKFVLKAIRSSEVIQEECKTREDAISLACDWEQPRGPMYMAWAEVSHIEDENGNMVVSKDELREIVDERVDTA